jgi:hypothetical protein
MILHKSFLIVSFALWAAMFPATNNYNLSKDYTVTIHGTSNLHAWDEKVGMVTGNSSVTLNNDGTFDLNAMHIKMNIRSIKSESSIMDKNTYAALKADAHPDILFELSAPAKSLKASGNVVYASGKLNIAGVSKSILMKVNVSAPAHGALTIQGNQTIKMTEYGISPPTAFFGTLKTGDYITLNFKMNFTSVN